MSFTKSAEHTPLPDPPPQGGREHARGSGVSADNEAEDRVFAANRASSRIAVWVEAGDGASRPKRVREEGSLRVRFPAPATDELEAVLLNTAGGIAGGDDLEIAFSGGPGTRLAVTGAAAEKIYRSLGPDANLRIKLEVASGATLAWLPQETILFDRARMNRSIEVDLAAAAPGWARGSRAVSCSIAGACGAKNGCCLRIRCDWTAPSPKSSLHRLARAVGSRSRACWRSPEMTPWWGRYGSKHFAARSGSRPGTVWRWRGSLPTPARSCGRIS